MVFTNSLAIQLRSEPFIWKLSRSHSAGKVSILVLLNSPSPLPRRLPPQQPPLDDDLHLDDDDLHLRDCIFNDTEHHSGDLHLRATSTTMAIPSSRLHLHASIYCIYKQVFSPKWNMVHIRINQLQHFLWPMKIIHWQTP